MALPAGDNVITVKYKKDSSTSAGDDCVYIYGLEVKEFISEQKLNHKDGNYTKLFMINRIE